MQERETISTQYPQQGSQQPDAQRRTQLAIRAIMFGFVFTIIAAVSYQPLYRQTGAWQILLAVGGITLGTLCLVPALRAARQGQLERAGYWALAAVFATFGIGELAWADATLVQVTSAVALMILAGSIFLPQQWILWGTSISVYIVYTLLVNSVPLWTRFEIIRVQPVTQVTPLPLVLLLIWLIASTLWSRSIRNRLLIGFGVIALLLAPAIGVFSAYRALQDGQDQVAAQLESVATLKEAEIQTWINTLQSHLVTWGTGPDTIPDIRAIQDESMTGSEYWDAYSRLSQQMRQLIYLTGLFEEMLLIDLQGEVILATNPTREGDDYSGETYFSQGMAGPYVEPPYYRPTLDRAPSPSQVSMTFSRPMLDRSGRVVAVLVGRANFETLNALMLERAGLGETGQTYLVGANYAVLTLERKEIGVTFVRTQATEAAIEGGVGGSDIYEGYHGDTVIGVYHWLPELEMVLLAEQDQSEILGTIYETWAINAGLVAVLVLLAIVLALVITRSIAAPLANLAEVTARMAEGELETTAIEAREDEIGKLSQAFDSMTFQMRGLIDSLEHRVAARTQELERRSSFLEASTEVARAAASILDTDRLIEQVVVLIRERFNLYYVGLFLLDEARRWAVMRAGTGEAGQAMLARDHRLEVGDGSMIGWSIANRQARIAQEAGADAVRLATPELPATRSEAALPLQSRGEIFGALSVQSSDIGAFDTETTSLLQAMADQVAIAIDNARLLEESQEALKTTRRAYGELSAAAWAELLRTQTELSFTGHEQGVTAASDHWTPETERALSDGRTVVGNGSGPAGNRLPVAVPIKVRDQVIGVLDTYKLATEGPWNQGELALLETLADQLGLALESARLYEEAQRRAARERLTREITDRMRSATAVDEIIQSAVDDIFGALNASRAFVRLGKPQHHDDGSDAG